MCCYWFWFLNPCNVLRSLWRFAVYCWTRLKAFWTRLTGSAAPPANAISPTMARLLAASEILERIILYNARQASIAPMEGSTHSEKSPRNGLGIPETEPKSVPLYRKSTEADSKKSPLNADSSTESALLSSSREPLLSISKHLLRNKQSQQTQEPPVVRHRDSQSEERSSTTASTSNQVSEPPGKNYGTF